MEEMLDTCGPSAVAPPPIASTGRYRGIAAVALGNAVEYFDFGTYAIFAVMIGQAFFPTQNAFMRLLLSVSVFGLGFVVRPLGAVLIGAYADRAGRKPAMMLTLAMMALGTGAMAILPGYATIGAAAPILLVCTRLIQGLAWGGEAGPATTYMLESAPLDRRARSACWQLATQGLATIAAGLVGYLLTISLSESALYAWGWRVPFVFGLLVLPIGVYIRRKLADTYEGHGAPESAREVLRELNHQHRRPLVLGLLIIFGVTITQYFLNYMTTFALTELHMASSVAMLASLTTGAMLTVSALVGGWLCDRFGRRPVLIWPRMALLILIFPALKLIGTHPTPAVLLSTLAVLTAVHGLSASAVIVLLAESFPTRVRATGFSLVYAVGVSLFGGTAQSIVTWLIGTTGDPLSPVGYLLATNLVSIVAAFFAPETIPVRRNAH